VWSISPDETKMTDDEGSPVLSSPPPSSLYPMSVSPGGFGSRMRALALVGVTHLTIDRIHARVATKEGLLEQTINCNQS
jgi:hypothetical protein